MVTNLRTRLQVVLLFACIIFTSVTTKGQDNPFVNVLRGDSGSLVPNATVTTVDQIYYSNPTANRYDTITCKYGNVIALILNQSTNFYVSSSFTVTVPLHITMISATKKDELGNFLPVELDTSLTLNYRKDSGTYVSRSYLIDSGYRSVTVKIRSALTSDVSWDVTKVLLLENEMRVSRNYFFSLPGSPYNTTSCSIPMAVPGAAYPLLNGTPQTDELKLTWTDPHLNQTGYDLEWAWIDENALAEFRQGGIFSNALVFTNNASRVTLGASIYSYNVPLLYDDTGRLFYRIRPVQDRADGSRIEGAWTSAQTGSIVNAFYFTGHEQSLNWQVTTSYAEEGKRKSVIQYFDGTLRSRQTVTKDNTLGTTVVAETMYDYQGRPAIQVLPAPTLSTMISFTKSFNQGVNANGSVEYTKDLYDGLNASDIICLKPAADMKTTGGASQYYSEANSENTGVNRYIPNAKGYPFTETRYTPDATGRIAAQSGVGIAHTLGSGHETRYYYGQADQEDLDPLFGTDVGYASHYFKNMVRDANGQYSVSYVDMHGRTVATALAGTNPANLQPLSSLIPRNNVTKKLLDKETNIVRDRSIESGKELLVPVTGNYQFQYSLSPETLGLPDNNNSPICYSCMYDLEIQISNDCGNCNLPGNAPIYIRRSNFSLAELDSICPTSGDTAHQPAMLAVDTTITLAEGSYMVKKTLTLSRQAQDAYREGLYTRRNTVQSFESVYNEILTAMQAAGTNCADTSCSACKDRLGDRVAFRTRYLAEAQIPESTVTTQQEQEITTAYNAALAQCDAICNKGTSPLDGIRGAMLQDMTPDSGQYANIYVRSGRYNLFNTSINGWKTPYNEVFDLPACYQDTYGNCVGVNETGTNEVSPTRFISVFQAQWAKNLLHYHPEYLRLRLAEDPAYLKPSYSFDQQMQEATAWANAVGMLSVQSNGNRDIETDDPFFNLAGNGSLRTEMHRNVSISYRTVAGNDYSMWQLACAAVICKDPSTFTSCISTKPKQFGVFPGGTCTQDQDMIWNTFRQMYLFEKQKKIYSWSTTKIRTLYGVTAPTTAQLAALNYTPRFVDPATLSQYPGGTVGVTPPLNNTDTTVYTRPASAELTSLYNDNCTALAANWRNRLEVLKNCKPSLTDADLDGLVTTLKDICIAGSDIDHPLGASSVSTSSTHTPKSFEAAIRNFLSFHQMAYTGSCNPYMLSDIDPGTYNASQAYSNPQIVSKPSDCQCTRISAIQSEKNNINYPGTLSQYLQQFYNTSISQGVLDTLANLCDNAYSCSLLPTPIVLPPVLQCGVPAQVCIDCQTFQGYKNSFRDTFGTVWPQVNHPGDVIQPLDSAFTSFINYKTGFSKTAGEYLAFNASCPISTTKPDVCAHLDSVAAAYIARKDSRLVRNIDANKCDVSHWISYYGGHYAGGGILPTSQVLSGGTFKPQYDSTPQVSPSNLEYVDNFCFDSITIETRLKSPRTGVGYNPWGGTIYSFEQPFYFSGINGAGGTVRANFAFDVDLDSTWYMYYQRDANSSLYSRVRLPFKFDEYKTLKVIVGQKQFHVYIDTFFAGDFSHVDYAGRNFSSLFTQGYGNEFRMDYLKFINYDGTVLMNEEFDHDCANMARVEKEPCDLNNCEAAFAQYYNSASGTNYTFDQLNNISIQNCGKRLQVCNSYPAQNLDSIVKAFVKRRDLRLNRHIHPVTGCDTTHWASNSGTGTAQQYSMRDLIRGGEFVGSLSDTVNPHGFDYFDDICFDSMAVEFRIKCPGFSSDVHTWYYQFQGHENFRAAFFFQTIGNQTTVSYIQKRPVSSKMFADTLPFNFDNYQTVRIVIGQKQYHLYVNGQHIDDFDHAPYNKFTDMFFDTFGGCKDLIIDYLKIFGSDGQTILDENFNQSCGELDFIKHDPCEPADCPSAFTQFYNNINNTKLTYSQLDSLYTALYNKQMDVCGATSFYDAPRLCGLTQPKFPTITLAPDTCGAELKDLAFNKAKEYYQFYKDSLSNVFDTAYYNKCIKAAPPEKFTVTYDAYEYHYTLYYYDQAGNLVQTVPPEGVHAVYDATWLQGVATARTSIGAPVRPPHTLRTQYRYNTLNQVVEQETPDAGKSKFWYDRLGRLVISQNSKQATTKRYSYTLYDGIGRITEVGQKPKVGSFPPLTQDITRDTTQLKTWLLPGVNREEMTRTVYDVPYPALVGQPTLITQQNLRNRVSYTMLYDLELYQYIDPIKHQAATFYTYDIHGNVSTLLQDINQSVMRADSSSGNRFKRVDYAYDLISGKVNAVAYQRGKQDQFFHKYSYDAENRITEVYTSPDEIYWERDAQYKYYKHGPLARTVLGHLQVQGTDYAYTLQGWMKGVNSTNLQTGDDIGSDGVSAVTPAKDVLGFSLNYYTYNKTVNGSPVTYADYQPIGVTGNRPFATIPTVEIPTGQTALTGGSLYNGNISMMMVNLPRVGEPILYRYTYDQLNRIVAQDAYTGLAATTNTWGGGLSNAARYTSSYKERVSYDANGNILTYLRNGYSTNNRQPDMDKLTYQYERNSLTGALSSNRLRYVHDAVNANNYTTDIDDETGGATLATVQADENPSQAGDNYQYDPIGNLVKDRAGKLDAVTWTVYGKIKDITKTDGTVIRYTYDAAGNRITKTVTLGTMVKRTVYVRDAQGNVLSVYTKQNGNNLKQAELDLYGSSRLGIWKPGRDVQQLERASSTLTSFVQGQKEYELSNHLGNVMATLADTRSAVAAASGTTVDHYEAVVLSARDYYPFGMQLPGRNRTDGTSGTIDNPTGRIRREAEDFDSQSNVTIDHYYEQSGGAALNPLPQNAWAAYTITTPVAGTYTIKIRLSNYYTSAQLQLRNGQDAVLSTINVANTGWVSNYYTYVGTVVLPAGTQTLKFYCSQPSFGMDWWELQAPGTLSGFNTTPNIFHVEAEDYIDRQGMTEQACEDAGGTRNIYAAYQGDWADYRITTPIATTYTVRLRVATSSGYGVSLALKNAAGTTLSTINVPGTGSNQQYTTLTTSVSLPAGDQTLRVFNSGGSFAVNWLEIEKPATADNQALLLNNSSASGGLMYDVNNTFTVEFWVKPKADQTHEIDPQNNTGTGGESGQRYVFYPTSGGSGDASSGRAGMGISVGTNGVSVYEHGDNYLPALLVWESPTPLNDWTHVAVVYTNGTPSLYINGQFKKTGVHSGRPNVHPSTQFPGGNYGTAEGGKLDEIRIWKTARTGQQLRDNMSGEVAGGNTDLAGYWPMNEGSGNTLHDVSGNGRDVTLNSSYGAGNWTAGRYSVELSSNYRYAFNGKELDQDLGQDDYDYGMRIHDARLGRFLSTDPLQKKYPELTPYQFASNSPIQGVDLDGLEIFHFTLLQEGNSKSRLRYEGQQTRWSSLGQDFLMTFLNQDIHWSKFTGDPYKWKEIHVATPDGTLVFKYFKELYEWQGRGMPTKDKVTKEMSDAVQQYVINELSFQGEMLDGKFDGDIGVGIPSHTSTAKKESSTAQKTSETAVEVHNGNPKSADANTATVYRTQGGEVPNASRERVIINSSGNVSIKGNEMLFVTINDVSHQVYFYEKRGGSAKGASIVAFKIPASLAAEIKKNGVPQAQGSAFPDRPQISDPTKSSSAYGLPKEYIQKIRQQAIPGSGRKVTQ